MSKPVAAILAAICLGLGGAASAHDINSQAAPAGSPFAPYAFLVGDWNLTAKGSPETLVVLRFKWAENHAYLTYSGLFIVKGQEHPHFEGVLMWNGMHKNLDMLLNIDPVRGLAQEQGTVSIQPNGVVVRDITGVFSEGVKPMGEAAAGPGGSAGHYRQTFTRIDEDHVETNALREVAGGWAPTFPGADHLLMTRREEEEHHHD